MAESDSILHEIEEDMRRDRLRNLWRHFGKYVIVISVAVVIGTVGVVFWQNRERDRNLENTGRFIEANNLIQAGNYQQALSLLAVLRAEAGPGLAALAILREAQARAALGEIKEAQRILSELLTSSPADQGLRDLAALFSYSLALRQGGKDVSLSAVHSSFSPISQELRALAHLREGQHKEAAALLVAIRDDAKAPATLRERAILLLSDLKTAPETTPRKLSQ